MRANGGDSFLKGLFSRRSRRVTITGHHTGDIVETRVVYLAPGAIVSGNICAPEVAVAGLLRGTVITREITVAPRGQIVGDVHATRFAVEAGGQIHGWVYSLTDDGYDRLQCDATTGVFEMPVVGVLNGTELLPAELKEAWEREAGRPERVALLQLVQERLGDALLARAALEQTFAERVEEVAGETARRLRDMEEAYAEVQARLAAETAAQEELRASLAASQEELATQRQELDGVRALLQRRVEALRQAEQELVAQRERVERLDEHNLSLQQELTAALEPIEWLKGRVESMENALQASVQRGAEQEDAQLRWQELADGTQKRVEELESQLVVAADQLEVLRRSNGELSERLAWAEQARDEASRALDELRAAQTATDVPAHDDKALADAQARSERLDAQLDAARAEIVTLEEQLAWSRLSVAAVTARLQAQVTENADAHSGLREQLDRAAAQIEAHREKEEELKTRISRLTELSYEADYQAKQRDLELEALRSQVASSAEGTRERDALRQRIELILPENEALEREVARQNRDIEAQHAQLVEAQEALAQVRLNLQEQMAEARAELATLRSAAAHRIKELQAELVERDKQLRAHRTRSER